MLGLMFSIFCALTIVLAANRAASVIARTGRVALATNRASTPMKRSRASLCNAFCTCTSISAGVFMSPYSASIRASSLLSTSSLTGLAARSARTNSSPLLKPNISATMSGCKPSSDNIPNLPYPNLDRFSAGIIFLTIARFNLYLSLNTTISPLATRPLPVLRTDIAMYTGSAATSSAMSLRILSRMSSCLACISLSSRVRAFDSHSI